MLNSALNVRSDEALIERLRALDDAAWAELYDRHHSQIWRYAFARTGSRDSADEIAAQVFAEAVGAIQRFRYAGHPILAWLYRIARNHTAKALRNARREVAASAAPEAVAAPRDEMFEAFALRDALRALPGLQREVLNLRFFVGCSTPEIAAALGKSESAVYSLQARAVAAMRRLLQEPEISAQDRRKTGPAGIDRVI